MAEDRGASLGVALCTKLDLVEIFGAAFSARGLDLRRPEDLVDPTSAKFALAWKPEERGFDPYTGLRAVFSIGAGVDGLLACPSLPPEVPLIRMQDDDQAEQMAGFAVFHTLWHHRQMGHFHRMQTDARWDRQILDWSPKSITVGVLGFGHLGRRVARALVALGYPVISFSRRPPASPEPGVNAYHGDGLDGFLGRSNVLINLLPMTAETEGFLDADRLGRLPQGAYVINLGRGAQLVEADLTALLDAGHLAGASLDVFRAEPLPAEHPFWSDPRIFVTPHIAADVSATRVADAVRRGLSEIDAGRTPTGLVDRGAGY